MQRLALMVNLYLFVSYDIRDADRYGIYCCCSAIQGQVLQIILKVTAPSGGRIDTCSLGSTLYK